ncbi:recombinase family protein [Actinomadura montaniterrae]|uniref:Recombinase family protein n=1 Tax=Actinomadura montaniterrae TaxID=1803903 RepID=A0A6L3VKS6_9ACTN|nr:recombinase family protein [Actinomadura montaniterrae]KAB2372046.1 recombinase family protein [Actinomadura montaniterrae]
MEATETAQELGKLRLGLYLRESRVAHGSTNEVESQEDEGREWADDHNSTIAPDAIYVDNDKSASDYSTKIRSDYFRLVSDIEAGKLDAIWLWSTSRSDRKVLNFAGFVDRCRKHSVKLVVGDRIFDLDNPIDLQALLNSAVNDEVFSVQLSKNVKRGMKKQARKGKPHSHTTYGFKRIYDPKTGEYIEQIANEDTAPVVRDIIRSIAKAEDISKIKARLEKAKTPNPSGRQGWARSVIRGIATNKAYIGTRVHQPTKVVEREGKKVRVKFGEPKEYPNSWDALIDEETFWKAQNVLSDPKRKTTRPSRAQHLLSYNARCECGEWVNTKDDKAQRREKVRYYACVKRHSSIKADDLDEFVKAHVDAYLSREDVREFLRSRMSDDAAAIEARTEAAKFRAKLTEIRDAHKAGRLELDEYIEFRDDLKAKIANADERAEQAATPAILRPGAVDWSDIPAARRMVAEIYDIRLHPVGKGRRNVPVADRVTLTPLIGPDAA